MNSNSAYLNFLIRRLQTTNKKTLGVSTLIFIVSLIFSNFGLAQENSEPWPRRVLITNDDGIDNVRIKELARAFSKIAETYVVAPLQNESGSGNYSARGQKLEAEPRKLGDGIKAYGVDGFPADCIKLALFGLMRDEPPDLVISGINSGPNLGEAWSGSGTIGAARMAVLFGIPAIAVSSGLHTDNPESIEAAADWVVRFAQSNLVREVKPPHYLTVDIPTTKIKGVRFTDRSAPISFDERKERVRFKKSENTADKKSDKKNLDVDVWKAEMNLKNWWENYKEDNPRDITLYRSGYVVVVPMNANEVDYKFLNRLENNSKMLPDWTRPDENQ